MSSMIRDYVVEGLEEGRSVYESLTELMLDLAAVILEAEKDDWERRLPHSR
jgi:hypothetical protein